MTKFTAIKLVLLCLILFGNTANADVYGPNISTSGIYTISWDPVTEIPGRVELLYYEIIETYATDPISYNNSISTSRTFNSTLNGSYQYTVKAWVSYINPVTHDDVVASQTLGTVTVYVNLSM
ncbi:hypothetical protein [Microbulbifer sp. TYP-18]|uniref:hypothetical protein n=1 Tax=Microbulbifer sp. TYP-18 TaxID=3230024 RepID=UPI0034C67556